jgi:formyltetrahydrofolate deformylase
MPKTSTLLVSCPDRKGIVAALAQLLYGHGANILDSDQHTDAEASIFFQRIRFDTSELHTDRVTLERAIAEVAARFEMSYRLSDDQVRRRVAIFVSQYDHCLFDLLWRHRAGELNGDIALVIGNHDTHASVAAGFAVPFVHLPISAETKPDVEARQLALLAEHRVELVVLARYMQILSADFLRAFPGDVINIHHSFLPAFMGGKPYQRAYERGVKLRLKNCPTITSSSSFARIESFAARSGSGRTSLSMSLARHRDRRAGPTRIAMRFATFALRRAGSRRG